MQETGNRFLELGLDSLDRKIMYELDVNARQSSAQIAKKLRVRKNVVNYRINRLLEKGVILGFYTIIDTSKLGYDSYRVYLKFQNTDAKKEKEIIDFIVKSPLTWWVGKIDGNWDIGLLFRVRGTRGLGDFWHEFMAKYGRYVQRKILSVYTALYHYSYAFLYPGKIAEPEMQVVGGMERAEVTDKEEKVLRVIADNARMPTVEIAEKTGLTPMIVKYAIKKLGEKGVIKGFRTIFNLERLNYTYYKADIDITDSSRYGELLEFARRHPNIIYVDQTIGVGDFEPNMLVESHEQFQEIMGDLKNKFPGLVKDYDYKIYSKLFKIMYYQGHGTEDSMHEPVSASAAGENAPSKELVEIWGGFIDWEGRRKGENGFLKKTLNAHKAHEVFESCLGEGCDSIHLIKEGFDVISNDLDIEFIKKAQENAGREGVKLNVTGYDWRALGRHLEKESFDAVLCLGNSLSCLFKKGDRLRTLKQFNFILRRGGILIIDERNGQYFLDGKDEILKGNFRYSGKYVYCGKKVCGKPVEIDGGRLVMEYREKGTGRGGFWTFHIFRKGELLALLKEAGFAKIEQYSDYKKGFNPKADFYTYVCGK